MKEALIRNIHVPFFGPVAQYMRLIYSSVNFFGLFSVCALIRKKIHLSFVQPKLQC